MHYRDRVELDGQRHRANVWVLSASTLMSGREWIDRNAISVSVPATPEPPADPKHVIWRGTQYHVQGRPMPIMALGRLDHWEINAASVHVG